MSYDLKVPCPNSEMLTSGCQVCPRAELPGGLDSGEICRLTSRTQWRISPASCLGFGKSCSKKEEITLGLKTDVEHLNSLA